MKVRDRRLERFVEEEVRKILQEQESRSSTTDTGDTGYPEDPGVTGEIGIPSLEKVDELFRQAKEDISRHYRKPAFKRRVIRSGIISDESEFDRFLSSLLEEINEAMWEFSDATQQQTHRGELRYFPSGDNESYYEERLGEVPVIIVMKNRISGMSLKEMEALFVHELSHIENILLDDYSVERGPTGQRAFKSELGDIFLSHGGLRSLLDTKFNGNQRKWADTVTLWTRSIGPRSPQHLPEMRARLAELRITMEKRQETMDEVIQFSRGATYEQIVSRYGENPAHFLIFLDYSKNLSELINMIDRIASVSKISKQSYG